MTTALKNKKLLIGVLCAVLFLALVAGAAIYLFSPYHYLSIDVNPSIEVQANRLGKVTGVSAVNDDAEPILQDLNLTGMDATAATQVIIARLADEGYLNETDHNQILLTVRDSRNSRSFLADIKNSVSAALSARNLTASLAGQSLDFDDERSAAAHSYHMSVGKYTIAEKIHNAYDDIPLAALSDAKISELLAYAEAHNIDFDDLLDFYEESFDDNEYCEHCGKPESECRDACERAWELYCDDCGRLNAECRDTCDADGDYCEHCGKTERECRDACDRAWELYCDDCGRPVAECDGYCDDDRRPASSAPVKAESSPSSVPSAGSSSSAASSRPVRGDDDYCEHCGKPEWECRDACDRAWELYCDDCGRLNTECRDTCNADGDYCEHCGKTERECRDACDRAWELYCDDCGRPVAECDGYCDDDRRPASSAASSSSTSSAPVKAESSPSSVPSAGSSSSAASSRPVRGDDDYCEHCGKPEWECRDACERAWELYCDDCGRLNAECRDTCDADGDYCEHCGKTERECRDACERAWELYCDDCGRLKTECRDTCDD